MLSVKSPERPRHMPVTSLIFGENENTRRSPSMRDCNEQTTHVKDTKEKKRFMSSPKSYSSPRVPKDTKEKRRIMSSPKSYSSPRVPKALGENEVVAVAKEFRSPSKSLFESDHDAPTNSS